MTDTLTKPAPGQTETVVLSAQDSVLLPTEAQEALVRLDGDTLRFTFIDDSELIIENIALVNFIEIGELVIPTEIFISALSDEAVKTAAETGLNACRERLNLQQLQPTEPIVLGCLKICEDEVQDRVSDHSEKERYPR